MVLLENIYKWLFPILITGAILCFVGGSANYYLSGGSVFDLIIYLFPDVAHDVFNEINRISGLVTAIPVLNFFYWVIGAPFLYLVVVPTSFIATFVYRFLDAIYFNPQYLKQIPTNLPEYDFPTSYEPISWTPVTL